MADEYLNSTITGSCNNTATISSKDGIIHVGIMTSELFQHFSRLEAMYSAKNEGGE